MNKPLVVMTLFVVTLGAAYASPEQSRMPGSITPAGLPDLSPIAERAIKAAANIASTQVVRADPMAQLFYGRDLMQESQSLGSGVIVSADGYILTNNHVISDERGVTVSEIKVTLPDGRELPGQLVGSDPYTDLALVKVAATGLAPLPWGDSSKLRVAEWVLAIGNPYQFNQTVTLGIVSALGRNDQQQVFTDFIQTDAAINPGNSGGALINGRGELIGINTQIYSQTGGYQGIGFAVPSNLARKVMDDLRQFGEVRRGAINGLVELRPITAAEAKSAGLGGVAGLLVYSMQRSSTAVRVGFQIKDVIVSFNGQAVADIGQFIRLVAEAPIGRTAKVELLRGSRRITIDAPIEQMQADRRR